MFLTAVEFLHSRRGKGGYLQRQKDRGVKRRRRLLSWKDRVWGKKGKGDVVMGVEKKRMEIERCSLETLVGKESKEPKRKARKKRTKKRGRREISGTVRFTPARLTKKTGGRGRKEGTALGREREKHNGRSASDSFKKG